MHRQVVHHVVDHAPYDLVHQPSPAQLRIPLRHQLVLAAKNADLPQLVDRDQPRTDAVVHVVIIVCDLVGEVGELRLETRLSAREKALAEIAQLAGVCRRAVLQDSSRVSNVRLSPVNSA